MYFSMSQSAKNSDKYVLLRYMKFGLSFPQIMSANSFTVRTRNFLILVKYRHNLKIAVSSWGTSRVIAKRGLNSR